jgi:hypothetical protein
MLPLLLLLLPTVVLVIVPPTTRPRIQWAGASIGIGTERIGIRVGVGARGAVAVAELSEGKVAGQQDAQQSEREKWTYILHGLMLLLVWWWCWD